MAGVTPEVVVQFSFNRRSRPQVFGDLLDGARDFIYACLWVESIPKIDNNCVHVKFLPYLHPQYKGLIEWRTQFFVAVAAACGKRMGCDGQYLDHHIML